MFRLTTGTSGGLLLFLLLFPALNSLWALDPSKQITQYAHTSWRRQDGIFNGTTTSITQTTDGYVWIGTVAGLIRFDGVRFVKWNPPDGSLLFVAVHGHHLCFRDRRWEPLDRDLRWLESLAESNPNQLPSPRWGHQFHY
jgi:ligand-binding sensor domain-containing protein